MADATSSAENALASARNARDSLIEDRALKALSKLFAERGFTEKAPQRPQALQALQDLVQAVEDRDSKGVKEAEERLNGYGNLVTNKDIADYLVPVFRRDRTSMDFLQEQGWEFDKSQGPNTKIRMITHQEFYLCQTMTGMNFGPQFRVCNPYRVDTTREPVALSVNQLPETEAWQMEMEWRPAFLDAGLQSGVVHYFP
eukprot:TRINITY_DN88338_c0_g1_i1.p1 TRINITY_DN88338_c0_g1~~TRINITY_DN88338_c0_g1_i1.p1  ORF type:complete len:222 (-),score=48.22 TRINITY_DN88338_c0_g1_i1:71-667(-)